MKNKKLLTGMLATVLSVSMLCSNANMLQAQETTQASEIATQTEDEVILNDETGIPDENLYNAILETADSNGDGVLTVSEAGAISYLDASNAGITDLTGIEYCKYLIPGAEGLFLSNNQITDITPLKKLFEKTENGAFLYVDLSDNQIEDISAFDTFTGYFYVLDLSNNQITDVSALANITSFHWLSLSNNQIADISSLNNLTDVSYLYLDNNKLTNVDALSNLTEVWQTVDLSNNHINDISGLSNLKNLTHLNLSNNQLTNVDGLSSLAEIGYCLDLSNNQITNVDGLSNLTNVNTTLDLSSNQISDISGLHSSLNVGRLLLANNKIKDITPLANLEVLWKLDLSNNNIRDISVLDSWKEKEEPCEIITDGNPIGEPEPEQPEEDIPSEDETPSEPAEPETPSEDETPSEPTEPQKPSKPIYNADDFAELLETQNIVVKPNDYVTITFEKGSKLNDTNGKTEFDFTTTITTDFTNAKLPTFITENSFITKVSYTYSGVLPSTANIKIFVGTEYAGKEVFYFLLNEDGTFNKNEVQKVKVNEDGSIIVTQEHCSDYVITTENPETLYKATQTPEQPKDENTNNTENNENTSNNNANNNTTKEESPKTSDNSQFVLLSIMIVSLSAFVVLARKIYKRA